MYGVERIRLAKDNIVSINKDFNLITIVDVNMNSYELTYTDIDSARNDYDLFQVKVSEETSYEVYVGLGENSVDELLSGIIHYYYPSREKVTSVPTKRMLEVSLMNNELTLVHDSYRVITLRYLNDHLALQAYHNTVNIIKPHHIG